MRPLTVGLVCCTVSLAVIMSGCGQRQAGQSGEAVPSATPTAVVNTAEPTSSSRPTELKVKGYFGEPDGNKLVQKELGVTIAANDTTNKYISVLMALKKSPSADTVSLFPKTTFHRADLKENVLTVDISLSDENRLGSAGEALYIDALKLTLFQFDEVKAIEILVDGKQVESLMGHLELPHPIPRNPS